MNWLTRVFLVLLRLAIGWHFFFEGVEKIDSMLKGPTETSRPFTSAAYLREATGPIGPIMRAQIGDPDRLAVEVLTVQPLPAGQDPARVIPSTRLSPKLAQEWDDHFERFKEYYSLSDDKAQLGRAEGALAQAKAQAVNWLLSGSKDVEKSFPQAAVVLKKSTPERVAEYRAKLERIRELEEQELPAFGRDVEKEKLRSLKVEVAQLRTELTSELTDIMKASLRGTLSDAQKRLPALPERVEQSPSQWTRLQWIDAITAWGLVIVGLGLLLGLFTRLACILGAAFLLLLYLAVPPFPWLPEALRVEGHYYFVNKNLVEMLALLTLSTTRSGKWLGLDGIVRFLNPFHWGAARGPKELD
jgi:uncharacterized membrane protein YphA (DoxX/SURF4 family)